MTDTQFITFIFGTVFVYGGLTLIDISIKNWQNKKCLKKAKNE